MTRHGQRTIRSRDQRGFAMVAVLMVMTLMLGMGAAIHGGIMSDTALRGAHARSVAGFYAAEAGINRGMGDYRNIFMEYNTPSGSDFNQHTFTLGGRTVKYQLQPVTGWNGVQVTIPDGEPFGGLNSIHYRYTAKATSEQNIGDTEVNLGTEFDVNYIPLFQFLAFYQRDLEILPGPSMTVHGPIHTNGSLYLNSNNTFTIADNPPTIQSVHVSAAGDVWRGRKNDSSCTGTVNVSKLTTTTNHTTPLPLQAMACSSGTRVKQTTAQLATWLGSIKARVSPIAVPSPDVVNRGSGSFWINSDLRIVLNLTTPMTWTAGGTIYPIEVQDSAGARDATLTARLQTFMTANPGRIFYNDVPTDVAHYNDKDGYTPRFNVNSEVYPIPRIGIPAVCSGAAMASCTGAGADIGGLFYQGNIQSTGGQWTGRRGGFFNQREQRWVYMLNVNMHDLLVWNRAQAVANRLFDPDDNTDGGLVIFLSVQGPLSTTGPTAGGQPSYGVRVFGTPNFDFPDPGAGDPTGMTIASDQAAYIAGSYNVTTAQPFYDAAHPKMPAAIMADAINVLSDNWFGTPAGAGFGGCRNDCQTRAALAARPAATSAINAAFLGGVNDSVAGTNAAPGAYGGGLENYPRFHEEWSGRTLTYRGSFVSLGTALRSKGAWCGTGAGCNIYNPPTRAWDFDTAFQSVSWLPPLTPRVLSVEQVLFTENFR